MKIHDVAIQTTIDKFKIAPAKSPRNGPKSWKFDTKHIQGLMEYHAIEEYKNNRKVLLAVKEFLHNSKFENQKAANLSEYFSKFIDYQEKRLEKSNK